MARHGAHGWRIAARLVRIAACSVAIVGALPAAADTAAPWHTEFGRLVDDVPAVVAPAPGATAASGAIALPAVPLVLDATARSRAIDCLALAVSYEAGNEPAAGQAAVAQVVLNRVAHPAYPKSVCDVVYQGSTRRTGCQFSFTCDGSLLRPRSERSMRAARAVAAAVLDGQRDPALASATHYHANYVHPYWSGALVRIASIGAHIFYRFPGTAAGFAVTGSKSGPSPARPAPLPFSPWGLAPAVSGAAAVESTAGRGL